jgi:hypothetical protein
VSRGGRLPSTADRRVRERECEAQAQTVGASYFGVDGVAAYEVETY